MRVECEFHIVTFSYADNGDVAMPAEPARRLVQQSCIFDLLHGRTIGQKGEQECSSSSLHKVGRKSDTQIG